MTPRILLTVLGLVLPAAAQPAGTEWRTDLPFVTSYAPAISGHHVLDSQGFVYATSNAWGYSTARVSPDGELLWSRDVTGGTGTQSLHVAVDSQDNAIVAGYQEGIGGGFLTTKYDTFGNERWSVIASHGLSDEGFRVAVDAADNVYVTGRSYTPLFTRIIQTVKFDAAGNELWFHRFEQKAGEPRAIDVTAAGRVMVTGHFQNDLATLVYDTDGNLLWWDAFPGLAGAEHGVMTEAGDVYVGGTLIVDGESTGGVVHYDPSGNVVWAGTYTTPSGPWDRFRRIAVDTDGSVVAAGQGGPGYLSWSVVKFDPAGAVAWAVSPPDANSNDGWATDVALDASGAAYVTGFASYGDFGSFVRTVARKFDAAGDLLWEYPVPCSGASGSIALDEPAGEVIVCSGSQLLRVGTDPVPVRAAAFGTPAPVGGTIDLEFTAFEHPNALHVGAAAFGTSPGIPTPYGTFPLNADALLQFSLNDLTGTFVGLTGEISCDGASAASIQLPNNPNIKGIGFYVAFMTFSAGVDAPPPGISNAVFVEIE